jgi:regulator of protease activity HflC (stomatin/prohibitin superfamily)
VILLASLAPIIVVAVLAAFAIALLASSVRVLREYQRGVVFRLGRLLGAPKGPGLFLLIPIIDRMVQVDLRTITLVVPPQEVITRDNVPVRVNAVAYFRVVNPTAAIVEVKDVEIPTGMQRAMARQAEAERERRAKVIAAEGEFQASAKLADAAAVIAEHPIALQLRYLQTLLEISGTNNTSTILPVPLDLLRALRPGGDAE